MSTLIITVFCGLLSWRMAYPPLALLLFVFLDQTSTLGTAAAMPFSAYTSRMVWGGLLGAALTSILQLHKTCNAGPGERFAWRVGMVCVLMIFLIRISIMIGTGQMGVQNDLVSAGPLTLIIVVAYLRDRRAWWCFGFMLVVQLSLSLYLIQSPESRLNAFNVELATLSDMGRYLIRKMEEGDAIGSRLSAQFGNTITMATYAAVGVAAGLALLVASRRLRLGRKVAAILAGIGLVAVGAYLLGVSASRGAMIGLAFGILVHFCRARGPVRLPLFVGTLFSVFVVAPHLANLIPEDSPLWGRFALLRTLEGEEYRLEAMRNAFDAIMSSPLLGTGDYFSAIDACRGYLPHIGPYAFAVIYGIPVGLLACVVLFWSAKSDLTAANKRAANSAPDLRALCAFGTIGCWTALGCIMTNGYSGIVIYIALGVAMWPSVLRQPVPPATSGYRKC
jgi:hypothetical protein